MHPQPAKLSRLPIGALEIRSICFSMTAPGAIHLSVLPRDVRPARTEKYAKSAPDYKIIRRCQNFNAYATKNIVMKK